MVARMESGLFLWARSSMHLERQMLGETAIPTSPRMTERYQGVMVVTKAKLTMKKLVLGALGCLVAIVVLAYVLNSLVVSSS